MNLGLVDELKRIEDVIDALETRGLTSSDFFESCAALQALLDELPFQLAAGLMEDNDINKRVSSIISRLRKLETFADSQSEITSGLQKYIANPDK